MQTEADRDRYRMIAPDLEDRIVVGGNIKFDQRVPENFRIPDLTKIFPSGGSPVIIGASTHSGEEKMIVGAFRKLREQYKGALLILVPRHAERGAEIAELLKSEGMSFLRRSTGERFGEGPVDCLLADTTGELMGFLAASDIVIMGKTLAGNHDGQNIIEPAVLGKAIVCGRELRNFREAMEILRKADAVLTVETEEELRRALYMLSSDPELRVKLGRRAYEAITAHSGAIAKNIELLETLF